MSASAAIAAMLWCYVCFPQGHDLEKRFRSEAPSAWKTWQEKTKKMQLRVSFANQTISADRRSSVREWKDVIEIKRNATSVLSTVASFGDEVDSSSAIAAVNPDYWFELQRSRPTKPWVL